MHSLSIETQLNFGTLQETYRVCLQLITGYNDLSHLPSINQKIQPFCRFSIRQCFLSPPINFCFFDSTVYYMCSGVIPPKQDPYEQCKNPKYANISLTHQPRYDRKYKYRYYEILVLVCPANSLSSFFSVRSLLCFRFFVIVGYTGYFALPLRHLKPRYFDSLTKM